VQRPADLDQRHATRTVERQQRIPQIIVREAALIDRAHPIPLGDVGAEEGAAGRLRGGIGRRQHENNRDEGREAAHGRIRAWGQEECGTGSGQRGKGRGEG
jgi:hypothetical protein